MNETNSISLSLGPQEQEMIALLREEMNLPDDEAVLRLLMRQAVQRIAITCPACGHFARRTTEDEAECHSCLSVLTLSEGIWRVST